MEYTEVYGRLTFETAVITFLKKNGEIRHLLGTRNLHTVQLLYGWQGTDFGGHDKRCSIDNGNIAVFDLMIGESRTFSMDRLLDIQFCGDIRDMDKLNSTIVSFKQYVEAYEARHITDSKSYSGDSLIASMEKQVDAEGNYENNSSMTSETQKASEISTEEVNNLFSGLV